MGQPSTRLQYREENTNSQASQGGQTDADENPSTKLSQQFGFSEIAHNCWTAMSFYNSFHSLTPEARNSSWISTRQAAPFVWLTGLMTFSCTALPIISTEPSDGNRLMLKIGVRQIRMAFLMVG
jgi:hypothetical protein